MLPTWLSIAWMNRQSMALLAYSDYYWSGEEHVQLYWVLPWDRWASSFPKWIPTMEFQFYCVQKARNEAAFYPETTHQEKAVTSPHEWMDHPCSWRGCRNMLRVILSKLEWQHQKRNTILRLSEPAIWLITQLRGKYEIDVRELNRPEFLPSVVVMSENT